MEIEVLLGFFVSLSQRLQPLLGKPPTFLPLTETLRHGGGSLNAMHLVFPLGLIETFVFRCLHTHTHTKKLLNKWWQFAETLPRSLFFVVAMIPSVLILALAAILACGDT